MSTIGYFQTSESLSAISLYLKIAIGCCLVRDRGLGKYSQPPSLFHACIENRVKEKLECAVRLGPELDWES